MNAQKNSLSGPIEKVPSRSPRTPRPKAVVPDNEAPDNIPDNVAGGGLLAVSPADLATAEPEISGTDVIALLLADKRSVQTRRAYQADLRQFFGTITPEAVEAFLALPAPGVARKLILYKSQMLNANLSEATVNRRLSAVRNLLNFAYRLGLSQTNGVKLIDSEKVQSYRDTRGIDVKQLKQLLAAIGTEDIRGVRDTAIIRMMIDLALRRSAACSPRVRDFEASQKRIWLLVKGGGSQRKGYTLSPKATAAIRAYLQVAGHGEDLDGPLFRNLDHRPDRSGRGLAPDSLHQIVKNYGVKIGVPTLAPHKIRHSSITAALDATGDVRVVQSFSGHKNINTVMIYDDSRKDNQGEVSNIVSKLV